MHKGFLKVSFGAKALMVLVSLKPKIHSLPVGSEEDGWPVSERKKEEHLLNSIKSIINNFYVIN